MKILNLSNEHGMQVIMGVEPHEQENISDVEGILSTPIPAKALHGLTDLHQPVECAPAHVSRVISFTNPTFPNSRRTACSASSVVAPRSTRSREAISRWLRTSSWSSASRLFRHQNLTGHLCISLPGHLCSGFSTPAMASESCDHFERSLVSCFFPAAVSW